MVLGTQVAREQVRYIRFGIRNTTPNAEGENLYDQYVNDGSGVLPAGIYQCTALGAPSVWKMVGPLSFGVRDVAPAGEGEATGDTYYDDGTGANPEGLYVYTTGAVWQLVGGGGGVQSTDVNTSGMPTLGPIDLINGPGIALTRPAPGQVQVSATGGSGGEAEKPWNYHDLHNFLVSDNNRDVACHNGSPSQRCITQGADGRVYILWNDNAISDDFGPMPSLYLTIYYANKATGAWDTITYQLVMQWGDPLEVLKPEPNDFCLVMDAGLGGMEMLHILFISQIMAGPKNVYDAYYPTAMIGRPPSTQITQITLIPEAVNQNIDPISPCSQVAGAYQAFLSAGPGIVVVWVQMDDGTNRVKSNIYDPTQAVFQRYLVGATAYQECMVNDPDATDVASPSIECTNNGCHCCYLLDIRGWHPFYSNLKPTGIETVPNVWDNIMLIANGPIEDYSNLGMTNALYTTMVVLFDSQPAINQDVIILATRENDGNQYPIHVYTFTMDIPNAAPTSVLADKPDVYDESKPKNDQTHGFQLGLTYIQYSGLVAEVVPEVLIYKEMMNVRDLTFIKDFVLLHRPYNTLGRDDTEPFYHVPLECSIGDLIGAVAQPPDGGIRFHPTVHFSNMYMQGGWNTVVDAPWFPYNVYRHLRMGIFFQSSVYPFDVMMINQKPPYVMGTTPT